MNNTAHSGNQPNTVLTPFIPMAPLISEAIFAKGGDNMPDSLQEKPRSSWLERLVEEVGRAAQAGNAQTARLIALLLVAAGAVALVVMASR